MTKSLEETYKKNGLKIWGTEEISRSEIKNAPYNPRVITEKARKKLKANLLKNGLMGGIVWNRRTGNLVSGHQRLNIIDTIYKNSDYKIPVTVVDFDLDTEKAQNIALNNREMQGDYEMEKLRDLMKSLPTIDDTGFTETDTLQMFGEGLNYSTEDYVAAAKQAEEAAETFKRIRKIAETSQDNFYCVLVWKEATQRQMTLDKLGIEDNKFVAGGDFIVAVKQAVLEGKL